MQLTDYEVNIIKRKAFSYFKFFQLSNIIVTLSRMLLDHAISLVLLNDIVCYIPSIEALIISSL